MFEPLQRAVDTLSSQLRVALPAQVESYDPGTQRASVKPLINRNYADGAVAEMPVIAGVPVVWPRGSGASLTMPLNRGDGVLLVFSDRSMDEWLGSGGAATPSDRRKHDLSDAIAVPGLYSFAAGGLAENNEDVLLTYSGSQVRLKPGGAVEIDSANTVTVNTTDVTINCDSATINAPDTTVNGNLQVNGSITWTGTAQGEGGGAAQFTGGVDNTGGDITSDGVSLENHTHPGDSGGTTGTPN
ncbi:MAG: phage baseplate protein [Spiribacter salinus]|uniref:Phage baseplate protein n=1 Tax=Spiribacter salinus TaxID=1335746 RepID=A0A540VRX5_9GAMM|nr:MAG: phage baseplate protein [Spiribacter salinus]